MNEKMCRTAAGYESIRQFFENKKNIINLLSIPLAIYTVYFLYRITESAFGSAAIPNEYREVANIQLTQQFIKGINPYAGHFAGDGSIPGMIYVYGPLYSVVTALLSFVIPVDIITLHYIVTFTSILISASLSAYMVHEHTCTITSPLAVFLFVIFCTWRYGYINAVPDAFALMLLIIIFFTESRKTVRGKEIIAALLTIALFFTKQYFVIAFITLTIYKFFKDKSSLRKYLFTLSVASVITVTAVSFVCPRYWTYSIYFAHGPWGLTKEQYQNAYGNNVTSIGDTTTAAAETVNAAKASFNADEKSSDPSTGFRYEILQLRTLAGTFLFLFIAALAGIFAAVRNRFKTESDFIKLLMIHIVTASAALIYLGRNDGAWLSYYLQLLMPAMIMFSFIKIEELIMNSKKKSHAVLFVFLMFLMIFFTIYRTDRRLPVYEQDTSECSAWSEAYDILDKYCSKGEVYYSPLLGFNAIKNNQYFYNNGHSMVITGWFEGEWEALKWEQFMFPMAGKIMRENLAYQDHIIEKEENGEYSLITYISGVDDNLGRLNISDLKKGPYVKIDTITLNVGRMSYDVQFWAKK